MTSSQESRRSLRDVLGYGAELSDALNRFFSANDEDRKTIYSDYATWMKNCPHSENICFADITFLPSSQEVRDALTIVLTVSRGADKKENYEAYKKTLEDYQTANHSMAPHSVFESGLPFFREDDKPSVASDLDGLYASCSPKDIKSGMLLERIPHDPLPPPLGSKPVDFDVSSLVTFKAINLTNQFKRAISEIPLEDHWQAWVDLFREERRKGMFTSCEGKPMHWLAAIPVGYRHPYQPDNYELVASIYMAFDDQLDEKQVFSSIRYILLNLFEANATQMAVRQGMLEGKNLLVAPAAHELKLMTEAIPIPSLKKYFALLLDPAGDVVSTKPITFDLISIVESKLQEAARIERVVVLSKRGLISTRSDRELEEELGQSADEAREITHMDENLGLTYVCCSADKYYFELALLSALRNVVRHTTKKLESNISIIVEEIDGIQVLIIRNSFGAVAAQANDRALPTGSLGAIQRYVRVYSRAVRQVEVRRISTWKDETKLELVHETWQTIVPMPEVEGAQ